MIVRIGVLFFLLFYFVVTIGSLYYGSKGKYRKLLRVPGLDWLKEGVGRAEEMGKPILYSTGVGSGGLNSDSAPHHLAGLNIMGYVAGLAAETQTEFKFLAGHPELIPLAKGYLREASVRAGAEEWYNEDMILFPGRGGFRAAGIRAMEEMRPATIYWIGIFWATALILSETGNYIGALQIAGQPDRFNLPFQIAACDYVMMAEEMYVTGAYVSKNEALIGSVVALEFSKLLFIALIIIGVILTTLGMDWWNNMFQLGGM
jgi:hypothetical protein